MKINRINIGEIIRKKVEEKGLSKAKFAESLGIARQNVEKTVFLKHGIDTDLLCNICELLDCNLFDLYSSSGECNNFYYDEEIKATLTIEMGPNKADKVMRLVFGENKIEILNK